MIIDFEVGSGNLIRTICSDRGSEFLNQKVMTLLRYERIKHESSTAYGQQQNGIAERTVQTLNNSARVMLLASKLPATLHDEANKTACYLVNRLPTKRSDLTPYQRFTGRAPFIGYLVRFGEQCHILKNHQYVRKFEARTTAGFVVG